jgi:hypothetical protein
MSSVQCLHNQTVQRRSLVPDLGKAAPGFRRGYAQAGGMKTGGGMPEGAGAVPKYELQVRIFLQAGSYLGSQSIQLFRTNSVGAGLVSDERSAEFQEDKAHGKNVARSGAAVKKV